MTQQTSHTRKGKTVAIDKLIAASRAGFAIVVKSSKDDVSALAHVSHIDTSHEGREI
ncbi:Uncharacterised protein [Mycobacteroides abscessus subsp. abscessus]|uniref:hypothetical protein n=1 Tax=Mycobacteroides abscessus TaxID=36809 RepID=UPI00092873AE|nr:hypothetical protein [Mycobacteroides abscessus]SHS18318.1 Uncharacterised protein [Mycobacteroides abscessus subsp. abscessus]